MYAALDDDGRVRLSGRSEETRAFPPAIRDVVAAVEGHYAWATQHWIDVRGDTRHVWWHSKGNTELPRVTGDADWRSRLNMLVDLLNLDESDAKKLKSSINGVIAYANGSIEKNRTPEAVYDACMQRFEDMQRSNEDFKIIFKHPQFKMFVSQRVEALSDK